MIILGIIFIIIFIKILVSNEDIDYVEKNKQQIYRNLKIAATFLIIGIICIIIGIINKSEEPVKKEEPINIEQKMKDDIKKHDHIIEDLIKK